MRQIFSHLLKFSLDFFAKLVLWSYNIYLTSHLSQEDNKKTKVDIEKRFFSNADWKSSNWSIMDNFFSNFAQKALKCFLINDRAAYKEWHAYGKDALIYKLNDFFVSSSRYDISSTKCCHIWWFVNSYEPLNHKKLPYRVHRARVNLTLNLILST